MWGYTKTVLAVLAIIFAVGFATLVGVYVMAVFCGAHNCFI